jgi:hypothetical protein
MEPQPCHALPDGSATILPGLGGRTLRSSFLRPDRGIRVATTQTSRSPPVHAYGVAEVARTDIWRRWYPALWDIKHRPTLKLLLQIELVVNWINFALYLVLESIGTGDAYRMSFSCSQKVGSVQNYKDNLITRDESPGSYEMQNGLFHVACLGRCTIAEGSQRFRISQVCSVHQWHPGHWESRSQL